MARTPLTGLGESDVDAVLKAMGERLRALRLERKLRLADLAAMTGLSEPYLHRIEVGERWPSVPTLLNLAAVFGVEPSVLLKGVPPPDRVAFHRAAAVWDGGEAAGSGSMGNSSMRVTYDLQSRLTSSDDRGSADGDARGSPEELVGMALAGCFSMSLAQQLAAGGCEPRRIHTAAEVRLGTTEREIAISEIRLVCNADVGGIDDARFEEIARVTARSCVVSRALAAVSVTLEAHLAGADSAAPR